MLVLLNPPSPPQAVANREGTAAFGALSPGFAYPPHTLAVIVARMRELEGESGRGALAIDAVGERLDIEATIRRIHDHGPERLAMFSSWGTLDIDREHLSRVSNAFPGLPLIAFGTGVRYHGEELLEAGASHVLAGDPELALPALAAAVALPSPGLVRAHDLLPDQHNHAGLLRDPTLLPRPAWDAVPWQRYGFLTLFASRGCDDRCRFCAYVVAQGHAFRSRPAGDVAEEMAWLARTFAPRRIMLRDPVFASDRARALAISRTLAGIGFKTPWECESRPEHFDRTLLKAMARAGCSVIKLGVETADAPQLAALGRVERAEEAQAYLAYARHVVAEARRVGIATRVYVLVGLPGQTSEHSAATAAYLRQMAPTFVHPRPYVAYPRLTLGPAQSEDRIETLAAPLQAVAEERLAAARRPPSPITRLQRRLRRQLWRWGL